MTSVPSRLLLSSGSKLGIFLSFLFILLLSSCAIKRTTSEKSEVLKPNPPKEIVRVDTITVDKEVEDTIRDIDIVEEKVERSSFFRQDEDIHVLILAPFEDSRLSKRFVEFYTGLKLAAQSDRSNDHNIKFRTIDAGRDLPPMAAAEIDRADVIVGPYYDMDISKLGDENQLAQKLWISPWNPRLLDTIDFPKIDLTSSIMDHLDAMAESMIGEKGISRVLVVGSDSRAGRKMVQTVQDYFRSHHDTLVFKTHNYFPEDVLDRESSKELFEKMIAEGSEAIIVADWQNASFVQTLLERVKIAQDTSVAAPIYCFPQFLNSDLLDYSTLNALDIHISYTKGRAFEDDSNPSFQKKYFRQLGSIPSSEAYYGHDVYFLLRQAIARLTTQPSIVELNCTSCFNPLNLKKTGESRDQLDFISPHTALRLQKVGIARFDDYGFIYD